MEKDKILLHPAKPMIFFTTSCGETDGIERCGRSTSAVVSMTIMQSESTDR